MTTQLLHFTITGQFLTQHVRNLWTEGRQDFAIRTLVTGLIGMTEGWAVMICTGKKKLIGRDNNISMVKDNKKFHRGMKLMTMEESLKAKDREAARQKEALRKEVLGLHPYEPHGDFAPRILPAVKATFDLAKSRQLSAQALLNFGNLMALQSIKNQKRVNQEDGIVPFRSMEDFRHPMNSAWVNIKYGWIDRGGDAYDAAMGRGTALFDAHNTLEGMTGIKQRELEEKGWIKITVSIIEGLMVLPTRHPTKAQQERVAEFCQHNNIKAPRWWDDL